MACSAVRNHPLKVLLVDYLLGNPSVVRVHSQRRMDDNNELKFSYLADGAIPRARKRQAPARLLFFAGLPNTACTTMKCGVHQESIEVRQYASYSVWWMPKSWLPAVWENQPILALYESRN
jgi:hypothetical protein